MYSVCTVTHEEMGSLQRYLFRLFGLQRLHFLLQRHLPTVISLDLMLHCFETQDPDFVVLQDIMKRREARQDEKDVYNICR